MNPTALTYEQLEQNCIAWSQAQPDIRAALVVGSRVRINHPADEWSDLDLVLFTTTPAIYAVPATGLREIGEIWASVLNRTGRGDPEWRVMLAGGLKADFVFTLAAGATLSQMVEASPYAGVYERGVRVLFDKSPVQARVDFQRRPPTHPTQDELEATVKRV